MSAVAPLVPAECSMAGNDWFPFYFDRVRKSKWWRRASDVARSRNVMMWGEAFKSDPAGSLPDDDDELAEAAGYGMDVEKFLSVKAEIMAPWVLCTDGRWYHPTLCEVVLDCWAKTSERRRKDAERKAAQRAKVRGSGHADAGVTRDNTEVTRTNHDVPRDIGTQTQQTGQDIEDANASLSSVDETTGDEEPNYPPAFEADWGVYPHFKGRSSKKKTFGHWRRLKPARRKALPSAIARYAREGREPKAECGAPAMERWLERELDLNWHGPAETGAAEPTAAEFAGPADLRALLVGETSEEWVRSYIDPCQWRDVPVRGLVPANAYAAKQIAARAGRVLDVEGVGLLTEPTGAAA